MPQALLRSRRVTWWGILTLPGQQVTVHRGRDVGIRAQLRRLPPIASRDERIKALRRSERQLRAQVERLTERDRRLEQDRARLMRPSKYSPKHPSRSEERRVGKEWRVRRRTEE